MKRTWLVIGIVLNAIGMVFLTFYFMSLPWLAGDEKFLIWSTSALKLAYREVPDSDDYAFINTSYDLTLIDRYDEFGFPVGNQVITDRDKLAELFEIIKSADGQPKFVLVDIHFKDSTEADARLNAALRDFPNVLLSAHLNESGAIEVPVLEEVPYGISDYVIGNVFDGVYKYQLFYHDSLRLTPLKMHEALSGEKASRGLFGVTCGDLWMPNNFIINYRLLQKDINNLDAGFNPINLGELLYLPPEDIEEFLADKMVIIGDFHENDMHETLYEITAGPLILLNVLLSIENHDSTLNFWFFLLLFVGYVYLSYLAFYHGDFIEMKLRKQFGDKKFLKSLAGFFGYIVLLSILSSMTFFGFGIHLNVFLLACWLYIVDKLTSIKFRWRPDR